jgi:hypothetical protein
VLSVAGKLRRSLIDCVLVSLRDALRFEPIKSTRPQQHSTFYVVDYLNLLGCEFAHFI